MIYGLTASEQKEFEQLKKELFQGASFVIFDEDQDQEKIARYNFLMRKKIELILASVN